MPEPASGATPVRAGRGSRIAAAVVVPLIVATGTAAMAAIDLVPAPTTGGRAAAYLPPDGFAILSVSGDRTTITESSISTGPSVLLQLPGTASDPVFADLGDALTGTRFWRTTTRDLEPGSPEGMTVSAITEAGVQVIAETGAALGFAYSPAMTVLPADAEPGTTWSESGAALPIGLLDYRVEGRIEDGGDDCIRVLRDLEYTPPGQPPMMTAETSEIWCEGRGIVESELLVVAEGESRRSTTSTLPFDGDEAKSILAGVARRGALNPSASGWSSAAEWTATPFVFRTLDPLFGETVLPGTSDAVGVATTSGTVALSSGADVVAYRAEAGVATRAWIAHPGGRVVSLGVAGDVVLVATSERTVAAYSDDGVRLWEHRVPDLTVAAPIADGADGVVVVSLDGTVARLDLATGDETWSLRIREKVDAAPAVADGVVVIADRAGGLHAVAVADGTALWTADVAAGALVAASDGAVLALTGNADVVALSTTGAELWRSTTHGVPRAVAITGGVAIGMTDEVVSGWYLATGERSWGDGRTGGLLAGDGRAVLLGDTDMLAVDVRNGSVVGEWPVLALRRGEVPGLVGLRDRFWLITTLLAGQGVGP